MKNWIKILTIGAFILIGLTYRSSHFAFASYSQTDQTGWVSLGCSGAYYSSTDNVGCSGTNLGVSGSSDSQLEIYSGSSTLGSLASDFSAISYIEVEINNSGSDTSAILYSNCSGATTSADVPSGISQVKFDFSSDVNCSAGNEADLYIDALGAAGQLEVAVTNNNLNPVLGLKQAAGTAFYTSEYSWTFSINGYPNSLNFIDPTDNETITASSTVTFAGTCSDQANAGVDDYALSFVDPSSGFLTSNDFDIDCNNGEFSTTVPDHILGNQTVYIVDQAFLNYGQVNQTNYNQYVGSVDFTVVNSLSDSQYYEQILVPTYSGEANLNYYNNLAPSSNFVFKISYHFPQISTGSNISPTGSLLSIAYNPSAIVFGFSTCTDLTFTSCTLISTSTNGTLDPYDSGTYNYNFDVVSGTPSYYQLSMFDPSNLTNPKFILNFTTVGVIGDSSGAQQPNAGSATTDLAACGLFAPECALIIPPSGVVQGQMNLLELSFADKLPLNFLQIVYQQVYNYSQNINTNTSTPVNLFNFPAIPVGGSTVSIVGANLNSSPVQNLIGQGTLAWTIETYGLWITLLFYFYERARTIFTSESD